MYKIITTIVFLLSSCLLFSQVGELDPSFAEDGVFAWDINGQHEVPNAIDLQSDGKMVIMLSADFPTSSDFDIAIVRLNRDGTVDTTFADNGIYHYDNPVAFDLGYDIKVLDDQKILASGSHGVSPSNPDMLLIKLNTDGTPDSTFGVNGIAIQEITEKQDYARCFDLTDDGKIVAGGSSQLPGSNFFRHVVARFNENGSLDTTFADEGKFIWNNDFTYNDVIDIAVTAEGDILASGRRNISGTDRMVIYKILEDGSSLDSTFATDGAILSPWGGQAAGMILHSNDKILITGSNSTVNGTDLLVLAYNMDGSPYRSFGQDGVFLLDVNVNERGRSLTEQPDGKILITGHTGGAFQQPPPGSIFTVRIDAMGQLDSLWGGQGHVSTPIEGSLGAGGNDITVQKDGKVLVTGASAMAGGNDMIVVRYGNFIDVDMDGYGLEEDCVDTNAAINPGMEEMPYNGLDDDCDAATPDDDLDGDGFNFVDDCDETNPDINPDAIEIPDNDIDEDCDGNDLVGIAEAAWVKQLIVSPNPAENKVHIKLPTGMPDIERIEIYNYTGQRLKRIQTITANEKLTIDLSDLPDGLLLINLHTADGLAIKRVVKMK